MHRNLYKAIMQFIEDRNVNLVVMCTHRQTGRTRQKPRTASFEAVLLMLITQYCVDSNHDQYPNTKGRYTNL